MMYFWLFTSLSMDEEILTTGTLLSVEDELIYDGKIKDGFYGFSFYGYGRGSMIDPRFLDLNCF